ncbi:MAG: hypothetical protein ACD_39C00037G0001, partial [uncultured bacterium]
AVLTTVLGVMTSYQADLPPNQLIAVISCCFFVIAMAHNHMKNRWSQARASMASLALSLILVWGLSTLTVAGEPAVSVPVIPDPSTGTTAAVQPASQSKTPASCALPHDWSSIIAEVENAVASNPAEGLRKAHEALNSSPPPFFTEQLKEIIEQNSSQP